MSTLSSIITAVLQQQYWRRLITVASVTACLSTAVAVEDASEANIYPHLKSRVSCECRDSQNHHAHRDIYLTTGVKRAGATWEYEYVIENRATRTQTLLAFIVVRGWVEFVSGFITDEQSERRLPFGLGPLLVNVPGETVRTFKVTDDSPPIELVGHVRFIDEHGVLLGGGPVTLYVPRWSRLFDR